MALEHVFSVAMIAGAVITFGALTRNRFERIVATRARRVESLSIEQSLNSRPRLQSDLTHTD